MGIEHRATGRTTRLCDEYIQKLFTEGSTGYIEDHYNSKRADRLLTDKIKNRLLAEHSNTTFYILECSKGIEIKLK